MDCPYCANDCSPNARTCPKCGEPLQSAAKIPNPALIKALREMLVGNLADGSKDDNGNMLEGETEWTPADVALIASRPMRSWLGEILPNGATFTIRANGDYYIDDLSPEDSLASYLGGIVSTDIKQHVFHNQIHIPDKWSVEFIRALSRKDPCSWLNPEMDNIQDIFFRGRFFHVSYKYPDLPLKEHDYATE